ncbi:Ig-like domain repeat protein [Frigoribacterium sp. CFBP 8766]|uniref:Ig-like domain repeat protein n=1 Tax=Frigoribacterium sp. CFBP 8766 TaxID=2775273 RepID=UPI00177CA77E|nr:Ig-like domain repeat protein [Frigoribacterium sp. CFBP 8766]
MPRTPRVALPSRPLRSSVSPSTRSARRTSVARLGTAAVAVVAVAALGLTGTSTALAADAPAAPVQTTFVDEGFTGTTAGSGYVLPTSPSGTNSACLTGKPTRATSPDDSLPGCVTPLDAAGQGALRLTSAELNRTGGVGARQSVPITKGIDAIFDSYQYNGTADGTGTTADGIVFYLAATDPYAPAVPQQIGQLGGSLGYSGTRSGSGLANAYLGIGLDRYGNFVAPDFQGTGCSTPSPQRVRTPDSVTVRGPGNGTTGYCVVSSAKLQGGSLSKAGVTDRDQAKVPVEILINPTAQPLTGSRATDVTVAPGQYSVVFTPIGGARQVLTGDLPKLGASNVAGIPSSWIDQATGFPYKLTYGWVAGTGGASDVHEVNYLKAQTLAGPVPVLSATAADVTIARGTQGVHAVTPTVSEQGGSESQPIRTTTTFPVGVTPASSFDPGDGWTCDVAGQEVICEFVPTTELAPGTTLPAVRVPVTTSGTARALSVSTVVASRDAEARTVASVVTVPVQAVVGTSSDVAAQRGVETMLRATFSSTSAGATTPSGLAVFREAETGVELCSAKLDGTGAAACSTRPAEVGTRGVVVSYAGNSDHAAASTTFDLVVARSATATGLAEPTQEARHGVPTTLTATDLPADATGTVDFVAADGTVLCTATLPATSCDAPADLAAGDHQVSARYSGDGDHEGSTSAPRGLRVAKGTAVIGAPATGGGTGDGTGTGTGDGDGPDEADTTVEVVHGQPAVLDSEGVPAGATGTIVYTTADGAVLCTATLPDTSCTVPAGLHGGTHVVRAVYSGDANYDPAEGEPFDLVVAPEPTSPTVGTSGAGAVAGSPVRLVVSGLPRGATGTVVFREGDTVLCTVVLPADGCDVTGLAAGTRSITADYSGDADFAASSVTTTVVVAAAPVPAAPAAGQAGAPSAPAASSSDAAGSSAAAAASALAFTGSSVMTTLALSLGAALLLAGLVLVLARRLRRQGSSQG